MKQDRRVKPQITTKYVSSLRVCLRNFKLKNSAKDSILNVKNRQVEHEMHLISLQSMAEQNSCITLNEFWIYGLFWSLTDFLFPRKNTRSQKKQGSTSVKLQDPQTPSTSSFKNPFPKTTQTNILSFLLNYRFFLKFKLLENNEFNSLIITLTLHFLL